MGSENAIGVHTADMRPATEEETEHFHDEEEALEQWAKDADEEDLDSALFNNGDEDAHAFEESILAEYNLDPNDIKSVERLPAAAAKEKAVELVKKTRTSPTKQAYLTRQIGKQRDTIGVVHILYHMLLSGEGHAVSTSSYQRRMGAPKKTVSEAVVDLDSANKAAADVLKRSLDSGEDMARAYADAHDFIIDTLPDGDEKKRYYGQPGWMRQEALDYAFKKKFGDSPREYAETNENINEAKGDNYHSVFVKNNGDWAHHQDLDNAQDAAEEMRSLRNQGEKPKKIIVSKDQADWRNPEHLASAKKKLGEAISEHVIEKDIEPAWNAIKRAEAKLGPLGKQRYDLVADQFPNIPLKDVYEIVNRINQLEKEKRAEELNWMKGPAEKSRIAKRTGKRTSRSIHPKEAIEEGPWANPNTLDKAKKFKALFDYPFSFNDATELLSNVVGDDNLFDELDGIAKKESLKDARPFVANWLYSHWLSKLNPATGNTSDHTWKEDWDPNALRLVLDTIYPYVKRFEGAEYDENRYLGLPTLLQQGSYERLVVEMIADEIKKGKSPAQISETLSFNEKDVEIIYEMILNLKKKN